MQAEIGTPPGGTSHHENLRPIEKALLTASSTLRSKSGDPQEVLKGFTASLTAAGFCVFVLEQKPENGQLQIVSAGIPGNPLIDAGLLPTWQNLQGANDFPTIIQLPQSVAERLTGSWSGTPCLALPLAGQNCQGWLVIANPLLTAADLPLSEVLTNILCLALSTARLSVSAERAEIQYQHLFESSLDGMLIIQPETALIVSTNRMVSQLSGYSQLELQGMHILQLAAPAYRDLFEVIFDTVLVHGHSVLDMPLQKKDGDSSLVNLSLNLFSTNDRQLIQVTLHDIAESESIKDALRESEAKFRALAETTTSSIFIYQDGFFKYVNPALLAVTGYSREEILSLSVWDLIHPDYRESVREQTNRATVEISPSHYEMMIRNKNGEDRWLDLSIREIDYQGKPARLGSAFDITERKKTEKALKESEEKLRSLVTVTNDGVVVVDEHGRITEWNQGQETITGIKREEALGLPIWEVQLSLSSCQPVTAETQASLKASILTFLETGKAPWVNQLREQEIQPANGAEKRIIQVVTFPIPTHFGFMAGSITRDVTNHKEMEAELRRRAEEAETLRKATSALASTLNLNEVLSSIIHYLEQVLSFDSAAIFMLEGSHLIGRATLGLPEPDLVLNQRFPADDHLFNRILKTGSTLILEDVWEDSQFKAYGNTGYVRGWMGVPFIVKNQVIGLLTCDSREVGKYGPAEAALAEAFANQAAMAIENARLFETEGKRAAELEALRQASLSVTSSIELPQVLDAILKSALSLMQGVDNSHIFLYTNEDEERLVFGAAMWADGRVNQPWSQPRQNGLTHTVARQGEAILVSDMSTHPLFTGMNWSGAIIAIPLKIGQRVVGVMNTAYQEPRDFSEDELHILRLLGDQAALAIENARLFEQAATERRHLSLLYEVGRELNTSLNEDEILEKAISLTTRALNGMVGQAFAYLPEEDRLSLRAIYGWSEEKSKIIEHQLNLKPGVGLVGWVAQHMQAVIVPDVYKDERWLKVPGLDDEALTAIAAPITSGGHLLGVLMVLDSKLHAFSTDQLALLQAICQELALALSNAGRYQQIERRLAEMTLIQNLTETFTQRLELQVLLNEVVVQLGERLGYPQVEIFMRQGDELHLRAYYGMPPEIECIPIQQGVLGRVAREGKTVLIPDVRKDPDFLDCLEDVKAELAAPIFRRGSVIGVINIQTDRSDLLTQQDRNLIQVLAGQISIAVENASLYERIRRHAEELEIQVERRTAELAELYKLSQEIGYQLSYDELLRLLLRHLLQAVNCDTALGCLVPSDQSEVWIETERPVLPAVLQELKGSIIDPFLREQVFSGSHEPDNTKMVIMDEFAIDQRVQPVQKIADILLAPIQIEQKTIGFLVAAYESRQPSLKEQERLITTFANQAAAAVQRVNAILSAQQQHLESLVEHLPVGILLLDSDFEMLVANSLGREMLGILNDQLYPNRLEYLGPYSSEELLAHEHDPLPFEINLGGSPKRSFATQIRPISTETRQWVLTIREITQEKEAQERIQIQERLATVGQLAAGIAHDFNNIMAAILVYTDLLRRDPSLQSASGDKLTIIQQQVQRATSLIRQILDFSRRSVMEQSKLDLLPFIKELDKLLGRILPENIRMELVYQPGNYWVNADPTRLQQVFMNLAVNSRDAMKDGGQIKFELSRLSFEAGDQSPLGDMPPGKWIRVAISDNGSGIPSHILPHIFEPFFTTKPVGQGTGLGLAQVYGIVKQHGGFIDVASRDGEGTTFTIYLPNLTISEEEPGSAPALPFEGGGETILLVEDNDATRDALQALLESHHYQVLAAENGSQALQLFDKQENQIQLVVSDLVMPLMGGIALYRELKQRRPNIRMLLMTGHPLEVEGQAMLETGMVRWLQKPFSVAEFKEAVQELLFMS